MPYTQASFALSSQIWNYCVKLNVQVGLIHDFSIQYMPSVWLNSYVSNNLKVQENAFFWPKFQKTFQGWHPRTPWKIFAPLERKNSGLRPQVIPSAYTSKQQSYAPRYWNYLDNITVFGIEFITNLLTPVKILGKVYKLLATAKTFDIWNLEPDLGYLFKAVNQKAY